MTAGFTDSLAEYTFNAILFTMGSVKRLTQYFKTVRPRFWILFFSGLLIVLIALYAAQQNYIDRQNETIAQLTGEYAALREASAALEDEISYTYTDAYIEREARGKLGLIHEGETLYQSSGVSEGE